MTFLIDENLSPRLGKILERVFPHCVHVRDAGLAEASDASIWAHAQSEGFALLSKDDDFREIVERSGPPPKFVWLRLGNVSTAVIADALIQRAGEIQSFLSKPAEAIMEIAPMPHL